MYSHLVGNKQCPRCAKKGNDRSGDNLGVFSDGHKYCFRCQFYVGASGISRLHNMERDPEEKQSNIFLPVDSSTTYPLRCREWCARYEVGTNLLLRNKTVWAEANQRLIFPIFSDENLIAYTGRYFGEEPLVNLKRKWDSQGINNNLFHFIGRSERHLVLVEDIISAIKVSQFAQAMPLFGSNIGLERWKRLSKIVGTDIKCIVWLDPDMRKQSIKEAALGSSIGMNTGIVFSDKDPKEVSREEIQERILGTRQILE